MVENSKNIIKNISKNIIKNDCEEDDEKIVGIPIVPRSTYQLADIDLSNEWYDFDNRVIYLPQEIDKFTMRYVNMIYRWNRQDNEAGIPKEDRKPLTIIITGWGGDLYVCYAMISAIKSYGGKVITITQSVACSACALIFICGTKGYRYMTKYSYILLHQGSGSSSYGSYAQQDASQKNYQRLIKMMEEIILSNTNIDPKVWKKIQDKENYYYLNDCLKYGICDKELVDLDDIWHLEEFQNK